MLTLREIPNPSKPIKEMKPVEFLDALLKHVPDKRYRMIRYYGLYCSAYLNNIPKHLKITQQKIPDQAIDQLQNKEFELYRIAFIKAGKPDPLYCKTCKRDKILVGIQYKNKFIEANLDYDDSS